MVQKKYSCLNGVKGLAAVEIACVYHLATINYPYKSGLPFEKFSLFSWCYRNGGIFVELFYLLSGLLAFYVYSEKIAEGMSFTQFMKKRILRIFPLMWITLGTTVILDLIYGSMHEHSFFIGGVHDNILTLFLSLFGAQAMFSVGQSWNYPAWTLSQFFICWAIYYWIVRLGKNRKSYNIWGCLIFIMLGISLQTSWNIEVIFLNSTISGGYIAFFAGGCLYYLNKYIQGQGLQKKAIIISLMWLLIIVALRIYGVQLEWKSATYSLCIFPEIMIIVLNFGVLNRLLSMKIFNWLGEISFAIYLCNFSVELLIVILNDYFVLNINASTPTFFIVNFILNITFATLIHYTFEKYLSIKMKQVLH